MGYNERQKKSGKTQSAGRSPPGRDEAPINVPGITTNGFDACSACFIRYGTAIPTNEIGPAKAVTLAELPVLVLA